MRLNKGMIGVIALAAVLAFAGCGSNKDKNETTAPTTGVTTEATTGATTEATTEGTTEEAGDVMDKIHTAVKEAYGEGYVPNMAFDSETAKELFGLNPEWYDTMVAEGPMISAQVDTFIAVHPTEGNRKNVEDALKAYRDALINDTMQYPMNQIKIQASKVETIGDYVFFIMLGQIDMDIEEEDAMLKAYEEQNQIAVDAIQSVIGK